MLGLSFDDYTDFIINTFNDEINEIKGFHIDHIKPLNRAINEDEYIKFWHYTNTKAESPSKNSGKRDCFDYEYFVHGGDKPPAIEKLEIFANGTKGYKEHVFNMTMGIPRSAESFTRLQLIGEEGLKEIITEKYGYFKLHLVCFTSFSKKYKNNIFYICLITILKA